MRKKMPAVMHDWRISWKLQPNTPEWYSFLFPRWVAHIWNRIVCDIKGHDFIDPFTGICCSCSRKSKPFRMSKEARMYLKRKLKGK